MRRILAFSCVLFLAACGSSAPPAPAAPSGPSAPASSSENVVGPPEAKWAEMTPEQKGKYMGAVVMPRMKELFVAFDSKEFGNFSCGTCHGNDAKERQFKMPNPNLPVLPGDEAGFGALMKDHPDVMKFMAEKVKPEMAKLLGMPERGPNNHEPTAFGCTHCHTTAKK